MEQNPLLSLDSDILGPLHEAGEVALGLDVASDSEIASVLLEQGALNVFDASFAASRGSDYLLAFRNFLNLRANRLGAATAEKDYLP